jgi:hypothetical protein
VRTIEEASPEFGFEPAGLAPGPASYTDAWRAELGLA